ncbi:hypothetical protein BGZ58_004896 [Dissophora ornata]|nr:hypothetical protein BGZ58_004896 [Dissophora ornata]
MHSPVLLLTLATVALGATVRIKSDMASSESQNLIAALNIGSSGASRAPIIVNLGCLLNPNVAASKPQREVVIVSLDHRFDFDVVSTGKVVSRRSDNQDDGDDDESQNEDGLEVTGAHIKDDGNNTNNESSSSSSSSSVSGDTSPSTDKKTEGTSKNGQKHSAASQSSAAVTGLSTLGILVGSLFLWA